MNRSSKTERFSLADYKAHKPEYKWIETIRNGLEKTSLHDGRVTVSEFLAVVVSDQIGPYIMMFLYSPKIPDTLSCTLHSTASTLSLLEYSPPISIRIPIKDPHIDDLIEDFIFDSILEIIEEAEEDSANGIYKPNVLPMGQDRGLILQKGIA